MSNEKPSDEMYLPVGKELAEFVLSRPKERLRKRPFTLWVLEEDMDTYLEAQMRTGGEFRKHILMLFAHEVAKVRLQLKADKAG